MHPVMTMKNWSHHLHDSTQLMWHHIDQHLHSRLFWTGVAVTLLVVGVMTLLYILAKNAPINADEFRYGVPYPYYSY